MRTPRPGPPVILWRFLALDLLRRLALATSIFVAIIAFAAAVKPLADGTLGAADALRFMALASVPMLQFALPFAAGFSATLVYHDFAADNEAMAASVGGVSYRSLLAPAFVIGLALSVSLLVLTDQVIPRFFQRMEKLVAQDVARLLVTSIQQGRPVTIGDLTIAADEIYHPETRAQTGADHLILLGLVAVAAEPDGSIKVDVAARRADVWLTDGTDRGEPATLIAMRVSEARGRQSGAGLVDLREGADIGPWAIPNPVRDPLKFRTFAELRQLRAEPARRSNVDRHRRELAGLLALRLAHAEIAHSLADRAVASFVSSSGQPIEVFAAAIAPDERDPRAPLRILPASPGAPIEATWPGADGLPRRQAAQSATLELTPDDRSGRVLATLTFNLVGPADAGEARRDSITREGLSLANDPGAAFYEHTTAQLLAAADALRAEASSSVTPILHSADGLRRRIARLNNAITGELHERLARSAAALLMTVVGGVLALRLKNSLPLTVYLFSFFPALVAIITISGGASAAEDSLLFGVALIWSGVAMLGAYTLWEYARLRRH